MTSYDQFTINVPRLLDMMRLTRKHNSSGEATFINEYILPLGTRVFTDNKGEDIAYVMEVQDKEGNCPPILFSAHVDTVHAFTAPHAQSIVYDEDTGFVYKDDGMPLGADNAAGCAVLMHMIESGVPGAYVFHRGEECGGIGSSAMASEHAPWLKRFKWAIAFDRRGHESVITEMMVGETASTEFAQALADLLNGGTHFDYRPDPTGTFTDTANYAHLIPECTNVSVGYDMEHTKDEALDLWHVETLAVQLVNIFKDGGLDRLPVVREAKRSSFPGMRKSDYGYGGYDWLGSDFLLAPRNAGEILAMGFKDVVSYVRESSSRDVAELIYELADKIAELEEHIEDTEKEMYRYKM